MKKGLVKLFKRGMLFFGLFILVLMLVGVVFVKTSPQFGGSASSEQIERYKTSPNYRVDKFENPKKIDMSMSPRDFFSTLVGYFRSIPNTRPTDDMPVLKVDSLDLTQDAEQAELTWFGHSTFLLKSKSRTILIDPMFGDTPAPHPWLGGNRFIKELPISIEKLPVIDFVIISHDHYDHLDYESIKKLKSKVKKFYVPLGISSHLKAWGIEEHRIMELDWWDDDSVEGIKLTCAPAQHFSDRGPSDGQKTLWCSWIIETGNEKIYFSGDGGYGTHFKEIGEKYGPFDFAMLECGQYNEKWSEIHMTPEETAIAGVDLKAKVVMPIHWGAFKLAVHPWKEPVLRLQEKAKELELTVVVPKIGETIVVKSSEEINSDWFVEVN